MAFKEGTLVVKAGQYRRRDSHPNSAGWLHCKLPHVSAKPCKDLMHNGHRWHNVSSCSPATAGSDLRSCMYHWGSTGTREQQMHPARCPFALWFLMEEFAAFAWSLQPVFLTLLDYLLNCQPCSRFMQMGFNIAENVSEEN